MDWNLMETLISGLGGGSAAILASCMLLKKTIGELSSRIDRTDDDLKECREQCDLRLEKGDIEYKQIIGSLNEIKVQIARNEVLLPNQNKLAKEVAREVVRFHRRKMKNAKRYCSDH